MNDYQEIKVTFYGIGQLIDSGDMAEAIQGYEAVMRWGASLADRDHLLGKARVNKLIAFAQSMAR